MHERHVYSDLEQWYKCQPLISLKQMKIRLPQTPKLEGSTTYTSIVRGLTEMGKILAIKYLRVIYSWAQIMKSAQARRVLELFDKYIPLVGH